MKKILFAVMAAVAICFSSCGNQTKKEVTPDSAATSQQALIEMLDQDMAEISELVEKKDTAQLKATLNDIKSQMTEMLLKNPEAVKQYMTNLQQYVRNNEEQIKEMIGDNPTLQAMIKTLEGADVEDVSKKINAVISAVTSKDEPNDSVKEAIKEKIEEMQKLLDKK